MANTRSSSLVLVPVLKDFCKYKHGKIKTQERATKNIVIKLVKWTRLSRLPVWAGQGWRGGRVWGRPETAGRAAGWSTPTACMNSANQWQRWSVHLWHHSDWQSLSGPQLDRGGHVSNSHKPICVGVNTSDCGRRRRATEMLHKHTKMAGDKHYNHLSVTKCLRRKGEVRSFL